MHCCREMEDALKEKRLEHHDDGDPLGSYTLSAPDYLCINFCPFCGKVLPGALVTDWELHEKCEACHWAGRPRDKPRCICSKTYGELSRIKTK